MEKKQRQMEAVEKLQKEYDAFMMMNRYSWKEGKNSHAMEFKILSEVKGEHVENALAWIHDCYDCYYQDELEKDNAFDYLREVILENGKM